MKHIGSQNRETLPEAGLNAITFDGQQLITEDIETGKREVWAKNDHFAGYVIEYAGVGFEFCRSL